MIEKWMYIEDDLTHVAILEEAVTEYTKVKDQPIAIAVCYSLTEAEKALTTGSFSLIILDSTLPDADFLEAFNKLTTKFPDTPVVIMSNTYNREVSDTAIKYGAADYIVKAGDVVTCGVSQCQLTSCKVGGCRLTGCRLIERLLKAKNEWHRIHAKLMKCERLSTDAK